MCGIVGVLDPQRSQDRDALDLLMERMSLPMRQRGPDGHGSWTDPDAGVGFGHRRLSILDLSPAGAQPMVSRNGRYVLTYNGEIYDHQELADDLNVAGVSLRGHSDTEMLLESIATWGMIPTLERIDGMFAFGLWDREERSLTLARDRMGEKPLVYGTLGSGEFVFGSTLDALRAHPGFDRTVDRDALAMYFRYKYVPAPWTIFSGIHKLEPGSFVVIDAFGRIGPQQRYWDYRAVVERGATFSGSPEECVDELERLLVRSVQRRMVADVPVGAFLSGGIDSSLVVAVAQQVSREPVRTFTIGSASADLDESSDARNVAKHLGTDHTELIIGDPEARSAVARLGAAFDEPFGDSSQLPTLLVSELARQQVTVALSGDGGDELFMGYNRYAWVPGIWRRIHGVPLPVRRGVASAGQRVPIGWWDRGAQVIPASRRPRQLGLKISKVLGVLDAPSQEAVFHRLVSHWQHPRALVNGASEPMDVHTNPSAWPRTAGIAEHMAAIDSVTYLPDDILTKVDRATMAVSLEGRIPLLDRSIVEFAAGLPTSYKVRPGAAKWPLRELLARSVPRSMFERPKSGFGVPIDMWLRGPLREWAGDCLASPAVRDVLAAEPLSQAWDAHQSGRQDRSYELWDVLMYASWCEERGVSA